MGLEFGLKLTRNNPDDGSSSVDFQFSKDGKGHVFQSSETKTMFRLTAHLRGYEEKDIKIEINEDGTIMVICGEKTVEVIVIVGRRLNKKGVETRKFRKRFRIPEGVDLDGIKAKFIEEKSLLTVSMPKKVEGMVGTVIEEMEEPLHLKDGSEIPEIDHQPHVDDQEAGIKEEKIEDHQEIAKKPIVDDDQEPKQSTIKPNPEKLETERDQTHDHQAESSSSGPKEKDEKEEKKEVEADREKNSMLCAPIIIAGSTLFLSLVAIVVRYLRSTTPRTRN